VAGSLGGQIAGSQATLYQEISDSQEFASRLLDAVIPVILDPDEDEISELKDRIRATLSDIVAEFGRPGGAVLDRVDVLIGTVSADLNELKEKNLINFDRKKILVRDLANLK